MQLTIRAKNMRLTKGLDFAVNSSLRHVIEKFNLKASTRAEVSLHASSLDAHPHRHECHVRLFIPHFPIISVQVTHEDIYAAISLAKDTLHERIRREIGRHGLHDGVTIRECLEVAPPLL